MLGRDFGMSQAMSEFLSTWCYCVNCVMLISPRRHLLRLWLRDSEHAWATPEPLRERWENVYGDVKAEEQIFPLEPKLRKTVGR
jgi:hypothetical protein